MKKVMWSLTLCWLVAVVFAQSSETVVDVGNGIVGILNQPEGAQTAVLMLHGFGSQKDEVGNMYKNLAAALAKVMVTQVQLRLTCKLRMQGSPTSI